MAATGPMALVDYLDKYMNTCEKKRVSILAAVKKTFEQAIDSGDTPDLLKLTGTIPELKFRRVDDDIVESIFLPMVGLSCVRQIDLSYNELGNRAAIALSKVIKDDQAIEVLILRSNNITADGAVALAKALTYNERISHFDLSDNDIGDDGGMAIASMLQINSNIVHLALSGCSLSATSLIGFATVLQSNNSINHLDLSNNMLHTSNLTQTLVNDVMTHFARTMQLNYGIKVLNFSKLGITDWSMCDMLAGAIQANTNIEILNLSSNRISRDGGVALCRAIIKHASLNVLILSCCSIQDEGAYAIAEVLKVNNKIKELHLDYNKITSRGLVAIADALHDNLGLRYISLWGNLWGETSCEAFSSLMGGPMSGVSIGDPPPGRPNTQKRRQNQPGNVRLQPHMVDVSFYAVETTLHVAHAPRSKPNQFI